MGFYFYLSLSQDIFTRTGKKTQICSGLLQDDTGSPREVSVYFQTKAALQVKLVIHASKLVWLVKTFIYVWSRWFYRS